MRMWKLIKRVIRYLSAPLKEENEIRPTRIDLSNGELLQLVQQVAEQVVRRNGKGIGIEMSPIGFYFFKGSILPNPLENKIYISPTVIHRIRSAARLDLHQYVEIHIGYAIGFLEVEDLDKLIHRLEDLKQRRIRTYDASKKIQFFLDERNLKYYILRQAQEIGRHYVSQDAVHYFDDLAVSRIHEIEDALDRNLHDLQKKITVK